MPCANYHAGFRLIKMSLYSCKQCLNFRYLAVCMFTAKILEAWTQDWDKEGKLYMYEPIFVYNMII